MEGGRNVPIKKMKNYKAKMASFKRQEMDQINVLFSGHNNEE